VIAVPAASPVTLPVVLPPLPDLADHHLGGRSIVPAVALLELVTRTVAEREGWPLPLPLPLAMTEVAFPRFLPADDLPRCTFEVNVEPADGGPRASLSSSITLANGMKRIREHARLTFASAGPPPAPPPEPACDFAVSADRVYRELVPFGPRYCNLRDTVRLGRGGAVGVVRSPEPPPSVPPLLGCPYLLDAAMHLACLWGQRYGGYVAYPTGFARRVLAETTPAGERRCLVLPRTLEPRRLLCDLWLLDGSGQVCDNIAGLAMAPLAAGAPPPSWITAVEEPA
jgi:hypothetical protein